MKKCPTNGRIELLVSVVGEEPQCCSVPIDYTPDHVATELKKQHKLPLDAEAREVVRDGISVSKFNVNRTLRSIGARDGDVLLLGVPGNEPEGIAVLSGDEFTGLVYTSINLLAVIGTLAEQDISVVENALTDEQFRIFHQCRETVHYWEAALEIESDKDNEDE